MATTGNKGRMPMQEAVSIPLTCSPNYRLHTALATKAKDEGAVIPYQIPQNEVRHNNIFVQDLLCTLIPEAANDLNISPDSVDPLVVANVDGMLAGSLSSTVYEIQPGVDALAIQRRHLLSKYKFAGRSNASWEHTQKDAKIGVNLFGFNTINVHLEHDIHPYTRVVLSLPTQRTTAAAQNLNRGTSSISRTAFTIEPFDNKNVSEYAFFSLSLYVENALSASKNGKSTPAVFFDIRDATNHNDCIIDRTVANGHMLALSLLGISLRFLFRLLESGHLGDVSFNAAPTDSEKKSAAAAIGDSARNIGELFGLVAKEDGNPSDTIKSGYDILAKTFTGKQVHDVSTSVTEINNVCNNSILEMGKVMSSIVEREFNTIGTVFYVDPASSEMGQPNKHLVHGMWGSVW